MIISIAHDPFLPRWVSFQAVGTGSGVLGFRPCWCPSHFPSPSRLGVFHSLIFMCHWISFLFILYGRNRKERSPQLGDRSARTQRRATTASPRPRPTQENQESN